MRTIYRAGSRYTFVFVNIWDDPDSDFRKYKIQANSPREAWAMLLIECHRHGLDRDGYGLDRIDGPEGQVLTDAMQVRIRRGTNK